MLREGLPRNIKAADIPEACVADGRDWRPEIACVYNLVMAMGAEEWLASVPDHGLLFQCDWARSLADRELVPAAQDADKLVPGLLEVVRVILRGKL